MGGVGDVPLNLVVMGPPGAGKGTQAERFAADHGIPKISTGDMLRDAVHADTPLGRQVSAVLSSGQLVGDDLIIGIVKERLARPNPQAEDDDNAERLWQATARLVGIG